MYHVEYSKYISNESHRNGLATYSPNVDFGYTASNETGTSKVTYLSGNKYRLDEAGLWLCHASVNIEKFDKLPLTEYRSWFWIDGDEPFYGRTSEHVPDASGSNNRIVHVTISAQVYVTSSMVSGDANLSVISGPNNNNGYADNDSEWRYFGQQTLSLTKLD